MDLRNTGLFKLLSDKMSWHSQRQQVLAQNIANADTPEFKPRDLEAFDFRKDLRKSFRMELAATSSQHLPGTLAAGSSFKSGAERKPYETSPDGNQVVLEEQMLKVGQNAVDYQAATNIYRKQLGMLKSVLGRGPS
jgi:flagellar basal-body rod protein FlgB